MKRAIVVGLIVMAAVFAWWPWSRRGGSSGPPAPADGSGSSSSSGSSSTPPPRHVIRIAPDERQRIADRIAAAQREHHASPPGPRPSLPPPEDSHDLDRVDASLKDAMTEAIPILAECYDKTSGERRAGVMMTLVGDPSVGTLINADQLTDEAGAALDPALDRCLRDTFKSLELPPLHEGDELHIKYTFNFTDGARK